MSSSPSLGQQFINANSFDEFWPEYDQQFAEAETEKFLAKVAKEYPGEYIPSLHAKTFADFFEVNSIPYTCRDLMICFIYCRAEKLLEKAPVEAEEPEQAKKYTGPTTQRVFLSPEDQQTEADERKRPRELDNSPRSKKKVDVGQDLRREYIATLNRNAGKSPAGKIRHMDEGIARAQTARDFPSLKLDSPEFNLQVARLCFNQYSDD
jgi:hypothetical protein